MTRLLLVAAVVGVSAGGDGLVAEWNFNRGAVSVAL
jgi:hypothetical protein